jgi:hypothetical protein
MRFKSLILSLGLLGCAAISSLAQAGGESSAGGADDYRIVPAFFRTYQYPDTVHSGPEPVSSCYEYSSDFGMVAEQSLEAIILESFQQWGAYISNKRLNLVPGHSQIKTSIELHRKCTGNEDLAFYFGVENAFIEKYKGQFSKPFGFAQLVESGDGCPDGVVCSCSGVNGQPCPPVPEARGFIWIAASGSVDKIPQIPSWSNSTLDALRALVLHELGHVFGNGHVDGTVMTEKIGLYLANDTTPTQSSSRSVALYSKIDSQIELVPCMECHMAYAAAETFDPLQPVGQDSDIVLTFRTLMGRDPVSQLSVRYERFGSPQGNGKLTLMDATGLYTFDVNVESEINERHDSTPLFYGQGGTYFSSYGISYFARLHPKQGGELMVAVNYNMMDETQRGHKALILPLGGQGFYPRPIFVSAD